MTALVARRALADYALLADAATALFVRRTPVRAATSCSSGPRFVETEPPAVLAALSQLREGGIETSTPGLMGLGIPGGAGRTRKGPGGCDTGAAWTDVGANTATTNPIATTTTTNRALARNEGTLSPMLRPTLKNILRPAPARC